MEDLARKVCAQIEKFIVSPKFQSPEPSLMIDDLEGEKN